MYASTCAVQRFMIPLTSVFDVLYRMLKRNYRQVTYVRNITDIDDKIIEAAQARQISIDTLTQETTQKFQEDMGALNLLPPDEQPRATAFVPQMIQMIQKLIEKGHAYAAQGHVLFRISSFASYGALLRRSLSDMRAGARIEVAPYKEDPGDFVLWKPSPQEPNYPGWAS